MKPLFVLLVAVFTISLSGCGTFDVASGVSKSTTVLRPSASIVGIAFLTSSKSKDERISNANNLYALAHAVRTFSGSAPMTVQGLEAGLKTFLPDYKADDDLRAIIGSIAALYGSVQIDISDNARTYLNALEQVALGLEDAAAPWIQPAALPQ